jgi:hypothetical protein
MCDNPNSAAACASLSGSVASGGIARGLFCVTAQKVQPRVQTFPRIINVAV